MKRIAGLLLEHRKLITLTFEIFWILFFLLDMLGNRSGSQVPQFVYVNF